MATQTTDTNTSEEYAPIIIDLGKHKRKQVRKLRKGKPGKLLDQVQNCLEELKANEVIKDTAQPVVIIVREKKKRRRRFVW